MSYNVININEQLSKRDLELILEVNKRVIEIETTVAEQNEEIIEVLHSQKVSIQKISESSEKTSTKLEEISKELFKMQVLYITGLLTFIAQVVQMFLKK